MKKKISEYLTDLRNKGYEYSFIDGFEQGFDSDLRVDELDGVLTDLRNKGYEYSFIDGYKDGYFTPLSDIITDDQE